MSLSFSVVAITHTFSVFSQYFVVKQQVGETASLCCADGRGEALSCVYTDYACFDYFHYACVKE